MPKRWLFNLMGAPTGPWGGGPLAFPPRATLLAGYFAPQCPAQDGRPIPMLVTVCYSLKITLKRPLLTVNPPLPA
jgi:hypothetical protein